MERYAMLLNWKNQYSKQWIYKYSALLFNYQWHFSQIQNNNKNALKFG